MAQGYIYEMSEDIESIGFMRKKNQNFRESFAAMLKSNGVTVKVSPMIHQMAFLMK